MTELTKEERREKVIKRRLKRQEAEERKLSLLTPAQLRRIRKRRRRGSLARERAYVRAFAESLVGWDGDKVDVLLLSHGSDYASLTATLAECLKAVKVEAIAVIRKPFRLKVETDSPLLYHPEAIREMAEKANIVIWMHSLLYHPLEKILRGKKCVVFHGGTRYRRSYNLINSRFNDKVYLSLIQTGELLGRGAKNERWFLPPVNTKYIQPDYSFELKDKLVIGHFSSHIGKSSRIKGSVRIETVIESFERNKLNKRFVYRTQGKNLFPWRENLKRMAKCDIYIESLSQASTGKDRHDWSITALEACALGCITVTNFLSEKRYLEEYGEHGLMVANTEDELKDVLTKLLNMTREELLVLKRKARQWVEKMHSYEVVGERLKDILGIGDDS